MADQFRIGCDIGGTFTDFVLLNESSGEVFLEKCLTTPSDPGQGVLDGLKLLEQRVGTFLPTTTTLVHGTTLVINTILEGKGAKTVLLTTRGFRDVIEMRREQRYDKFDLFQSFPAPLVPRYLRWGVSERVLANGEVAEPLQESEVHQLVSALEASGAESVAICYLHSYANPAHEEQTQRIIQELLPGLSVSLSSEVLARAKEYERFSTTVLNAYVQPRVERYLGDLERRLQAEGFAGRLYLMNSEGGLTTAATSRRFPVRIVESGPAGGVVATEAIGSRIGMESLLSFDMGGTTAKVATIRDGRADITAQYEVARVERFKRGSGFHIEAPTVDLLEVGAGGGSIAHINQFGLLQVGPESAGSSPGPASYGRGGTQPTVTDADLLLGYLDENSFLGGRMKLDRAAAVDAVKKSIAEPLGISVEEAAWGINEVVSENMASAARAYLLERGDDPTTLPMVTYGGAGPVHGLRVAQKLGSPTVIIPPATGALSALGFLEAAPAIMLSHAFKSKLDELELGQLSEQYESLRDQAIQLLPAGLSAEPRTEYGADMRYVGQGYTLSVTFAHHSASDITVSEMRQAYESAYRQRYGRANPDASVEVVSAWIRASHDPQSLTYQTMVPRYSSSDVRERPVYFAETKGSVPTPVVGRHALKPGERFEGPLIIEETESTTVVPPGALVHVHLTGALIIDLAIGGGA